MLSVSWSAWPTSRCDMQRSVAVLACWPLHSPTADLLRAVHVQASCLQPLTAWNRNMRSEEQLECSVCRACQRGVGGGPPAAVELAERRSSACFGLGRAQCVAMPRSGALDALIPSLTAVFSVKPLKSLGGVSTSSYIHFYLLNP